MIFTCIHLAAAIYSNGVCEGARFMCDDAGCGARMCAVGGCDFSLQGQPYHMRMQQHSVCALTNVCLVGAKIVMYGNSLFTRSFANASLSVSGRGREWKNGAWYTFEVLDERLAPSNFSTIPSAIMQRYYSRNAGHVLVDEVWVLYQMFDMFGIDPRSSQVVIHGDPNDKTNIDLYSLLADRSPVFSNQIENPCYGLVIIGAAGLNFDDSQPARLLRFRDHIMHRLAGRPRTHWFPSFLVVVKNLTHADHPNGLKNYDALASAISRQYPMSNVRIVGWAGIPVLKQMQIVHNSDIYISPGGSDMVNAFFLRDGSSIISPCNIMFGKKSPSFEIDTWFQYMPTLRHVETCHVTHASTDGDGLTTVDLVGFMQLVHDVVQDWDRRKSMAAIMFRHIHGAQPDDVQGARPRGV